MSNSTVAQKTTRQNRNEVVLAGNLVRDPEIRLTTTGKPVATFTVATTYQKSTEYHRVVAWEGLAERVGELKKGDFVSIVGRLQTRNYEKDGSKRYITEVVAGSVTDGTVQKNAHGTEVGDHDLPF